MARIPSEEELKIIKNTELNVLKVIKNICVKYDINYFMVGGTLIGAVRHKGFIPWDDDIDIGMLRSDYERFLKVAPGELPEYLKLVNFHTDRGFGEPFTKLMDMRGKMQEIFSSSSEAPAGIFVDIFAFDFVPKSAVLACFHRFKNYSLRKLILLHSDYNFEKRGVKKIIYNLLKLFARLFNVNWLKKQYRKNAIKYDKKKTGKVVNLGGNYGYIKETVPYDYVKQTDELLFEDEYFSVPQKYKEYLTSIYGDYMKLPPKEKQINKHELYELDLSGLM